MGKVHVAKAASGPPRSSLETKRDGWLLTHRPRQGGQRSGQEAAGGCDRGLCCFVCGGRDGGGGGRLRVPTCVSQCLAP